MVRLQVEQALHSNHNKQTNPKVNDDNNNNMPTTLNLAGSAITLDMMSPPLSSVHEALPDRLSNLSKLLQETPHLSAEQTSLMNYHLSALESILSPSSLPPQSEKPMSPPPSGGLPYAKEAPSKPSPEKLIDDPSIPSTQLTHPATLLTTITTLTTSLRARQTETQNLHSLFLLKLSTLVKRIVELEERVCELYVLLFGFLKAV